MAYYWLGPGYEHSHYGGFIEEIHPALRYTVPYDAPLFAVVTADREGILSIEGRTANFVPPTPGELGQEDTRITAGIMSRRLKFTPRVPVSL